MRNIGKLGAEKKSVYDHISFYTCVKISNNKNFKNGKKRISEELLNFLKKIAKLRPRYPNQDSVPHPII